MNPILLEGPDCSGKTTLARELEKCGYRYIHNGPPLAANMFEEYTGQLDNARHVLTVIDRGHIGETIYGPILREKSLISHAQVEILNYQIRQMGGIIIICMPPWRMTLDCWAKRKNEEHIKEYKPLRDSWKAFFNLLEELPGDYFHYDYTRFDVASYAAALTELKGVPFP